MSRSMYRFVLVSACAAALVACSTTPTTEQRMANFATQCQAFGFTPQTEAYTNCMMNLDEEDKRQKQRAEQCKAMSQLVTASTAAYNLCMAMTN